jgi:succinate dehydrogenase / fumarate reductase cytochrome b subunit
MTDTPTARHARPLSPHLQIYRLPLPAIMSITHRITGIGLTVGTLVLAWWVIAAGTGADAFATVEGFLGSALGRLLLFGWTLAFYYHLLNGIRHLIWDTVTGLELPAVYRSGWTVNIATVVLTLATWVAGYGLV